MARAGRPLKILSPSPGCDRTWCSSIHSWLVQRPSLQYLLVLLLVMGSSGAGGPELPLAPGWCQAWTRCQELHPPGQCRGTGPVGLDPSGTSGRGREWPPGRDKEPEKDICHQPALLLLAQPCCPVFVIRARADNGTASLWQHCSGHCWHSSATRISPAGPWLARR